MFSVLIMAFTFSGSMKSYVVILRKHKFNFLFKKMPRTLTHIFLHGRKKKSLLTSSHTNNEVNKVKCFLNNYQFPHTVRSINNNSACYHFRDSINTCAHTYAEYHRKTIWDFLGLYQIWD